MNRFSISDILLKSISIYYILLDKEFNITSTNADFLNAVPPETVETGKSFYPLFWF